MSETKQYQCADCIFVHRCEKEQKNVVPCTEIAVLCHGGIMPAFMEAKDVKRFICAKDLCNNTGVARIADMDELPEHDLFSPWAVNYNG